MVVFIDYHFLFIGEVQTNLKSLLGSANLSHAETLVDGEVSSSILGEMIHSGDKKDLLYLSWLMRENEKNLLEQHANNQQLIIEELK